MIVEFSVKNFRSISNLQTISFASTSLKSSKDNQQVDQNNIVPENGINLLKTIGIYGANASGKSNMIKALEFFCEAISDLPSPESRLSRLTQPFLYQNDFENTDSFFQIVLIVNVATLRRLERATHQAAFREAGFAKEFIVASGVLLALCCPAVEMWQLRFNDRGLKRVEPEVSADDLVKVFRLRAVCSVDAKFFCAPVVHRSDEAAVAGAAQVFRREKGEAAVVADGTGAAPFVFGADGLRSVFDYDEIVARGDFHDRIHIRHLAEEMNRDDGLCSRRDGGFNEIGAHIERGGINIQQHRRGTHPGNAACCCKK